MISRRNGIITIDIDSDGRFYVSTTRQDSAPELPDLLASLRSFGGNDTESRGSATR